MVEDVRELLKSVMDYKVSWVWRTANGAAHALVREGVGSELAQVWACGLMPPNCILGIVISAEVPELFE